MGQKEKKEQKGGCGEKKRVKERAAEPDDPGDQVWDPHDGRRKKASSDKAVL